MKAVMKLLLCQLPNQLAQYGSPKITVIFLYIIFRNPYFVHKLSVIAVLILMKINWYFLEKMRYAPIEERVTKTQNLWNQSPPIQPQHPQ